jgi:hypothetical protein
MTINERANARFKGVGKVVRAVSHSHTRMRIKCYEILFFYAYFFFTIYLWLDRRTIMLLEFRFKFLRG